MEKFLEKISSYNILNNFVPGAVFMYLSDEIFGIDLLVENQILNIVLIYFVGMIASRIGSLWIEEVLKKIKIIRYADYKDFIKAEKKDLKIRVLLETNNMYRTFAGVFVLMFIEFGFMELCMLCMCVEKFKFAIFCVTLFLLFVFSYKKQAAYIKSRVENICGNEEDEISRLKKENESLRTDLEKESRKNSPYPLISVIIPCYNAKRFVERAVRSIMEQSYRNLEILCCDDCSTDGTLSILRRLSAEDSRIKILQNETNLGVIDTLNKLVREASGVYIARMDADDISLPDRLAKQLAFMQQNPQVDFCGCNAFHINETGKTIGKTTLPESYDDIKFFLPYYSTFYHPTIFARADILKDNPYDKDFLHAEDYELWCRLIFEKGMRGENLQERLLKYRINSQGVSRQNMEMQMENSAKIFDKYEIVSNKEFHKNVLFLHCALVATNETDILKDFKKIFRSKKIKFANPAYEKLLLHLKKFKQKKLFVKMLFCTLGIYSVCTILFRKIRGK